MVLIDESLKKFDKTGLINFQKIEKLTLKIKKIASFKDYKYNFKYNYAIYELLKFIPNIPHEYFDKF